MKFIAPLLILILNQFGNEALVLSLSMSSKDATHHKRKNDSMSRRDAILGASASIAGITAAPAKSMADLPKGESVDLAAVKAAQLKGPDILSSSFKAGGKSILPINDPSPLLAIKGGLSGKSTIKIPRVGYSFYKTLPDDAARCTALALRAGVRHFDVGTLYGSNAQFAMTLKKYLDVGITAVDFSAEKPELLGLLDATKVNGDMHSLKTVSSGLLSAGVPIPSGSIGRKARREDLFISHKLANSEQSTSRVDVRRAVKEQIAVLGTQYLDMVSIHSPLTDRNRRFETYATLLQLRDQGFVKSIGVCNYGIGPLNELKEAGLDLPSLNQLELSPFNTHKDVLSWCGENDISIGCGAWSKLSGANGPQDEWAILAELAKKKGMTKAQVLVRWSLQKGYVCVPRSSPASKIERIAIAENNYGGVNNPELGNGCILSEEEMERLDALNVSLSAGKLGRRDGWSDDDVTGVDWDPTLYI